MRTLMSAALLAALLTPATIGLATAADLDYYEPRPVPVLPPPPPPCGVYRPCLRPYARFGIAPPPYRFGYLPPRPYGYGQERYGQEHYGYERFGYAHPRPEPYVSRHYDPRERYGNGRDERYEPRGYGRPHEDGFEHYGRDDREDDRFDRGQGRDYRG